eukprot:COSAG05_NODE_20205_length_281_cov_1.417582_1_plen_76_part_10
MWAGTDGGKGGTVRSTFPCGCLKPPLVDGRFGERIPDCAPNRELPPNWPELNKPAPVNKHITTDFRNNFGTYGKYQ